MPCGNVRESSRLNFDALTVREALVNKILKESSTSHRKAIKSHQKVIKKSSKVINNDDNRKPAATVTAQENSTKQGAVKVVDGLTATNSTVHINNYIITSAVPAQVLRDVVQKKD